MTLAFRIDSLYFNIASMALGSGVKFGSAHSYPLGIINIMNRIFPSHPVGGSRLARVRWSGHPGHARCVLPLGCRTLASLTKRLSRRYSTPNSKVASTGVRALAIGVRRGWTGDTSRCNTVQIRWVAEGVGAWSGPGVCPKDRVLRRQGRDSTSSFSACLSPFGQR